MASRLGGEQESHNASQGVSEGDVEATPSGEVASQEDQGLVRVGRWMSRREYEAMTTSGMVQEGGGYRSYVAYPADPDAYRSEAASGTYYVEFDVPEDCLEPAGKPEWRQIPGPKSLTGQVCEARGEELPQLPQAFNIQKLEERP